MDSRSFVQRTYGDVNHRKLIVDCLLGQRMTT